MIAHNIYKNTFIHFTTMKMSTNDHLTWQQILYEAKYWRIQIENKNRLKRKNALSPSTFIDQVEQLSSKCRSSS